MDFLHAQLTDADRAAANQRANMKIAVAEALHEASKPRTMTGAQAQRREKAYALEAAADRRVAENRQRRRNGQPQLATIRT